MMTAPPALYLHCRGHDDIHGAVSDKVALPVIEAKIRDQVGGWVGWVGGWMGGRLGGASQQLTTHSKWVGRCPLSGPLGLLYLQHKSCLLLICFNFF